MAKIDEIKEILNTLRVALTLVVGLIVVVTGALIGKEQNSQIDIYFWSGLVFDFVLLFVFMKLIFSIKRNTEEIKEL